MNGNESEKKSDWNDEKKWKDVGRRRELLVMIGSFQSERKLTANGKRSTNRKVKRERLSDKGSRF